MQQADPSAVRFGNQNEFAPVIEKELGEPEDSQLSTVVASHTEGPCQEATSFQSC